MRIFYLLTLASFAFLCVSCSGEGDFEDLFNGKDFTGFRQMEGAAEYVVEDGMMVGTSRALRQGNSFMTTEKAYGDFILEFDTKCDSELNSGVQFRSECLDDYEDGRFHGYQCEIDPAGWSGGLYDEHRRGWLVALDNYPEGANAYKHEQWNHYRIEALGSNIRIWVNGINTVNCYDNMTLEGLIGFQVHSTYRDEQLNKSVRWKNVRILTKDVEKHLQKGELAKPVNRMPNELLEQEIADGWELLFDGETFKGWHSARTNAEPAKSWKVENGALSTSEDMFGGDLISDKKYSAFEFALEFRMTDGANSGIKYFVAESVNGNRKSYYGLEYQILDNALHRDAKLYTTYPGSRMMASLYDIQPALQRHIAPNGMWNLAEIKVFANDDVEHWLNGKKVLEYNRKSEDIKQRLSNSKFNSDTYCKSEYAFGMAPEGYIMLQDHGDVVEFRSIKIKELN